MKYVYAGDRDISVDILKFLIDKGYKPDALFVSAGDSASHADELISLVSDFLSADRIFRGKDFTNSLDLLKVLTPDYIIGIHFPYIIRKEFLELPAVGFLNLHPAYLPYNKGWHTPSWALLENTPYGATLHFMSEELDAGDIIHQKLIVPTPEDTANTLYKKVKRLEIDVFKEAFPELLTLAPTRLKQSKGEGTSHNKNHLAKLQEEISHDVTFKDYVNLLRAFTTNNHREAFYFVENGIKYHVQVTITPDNL
jgi:methionyl-tRNA formyltransferase